jgi:hypothetical protein
MSDPIFEASSDAKADLIHREEEILETMINEYKSGRWPDAAPWRVVPAERLKRIWQDSAQLGFVRDEKGLLAIRDRFVENFLRLSVNTAISGHATYSYREVLDDHFEGEEDIQAFVDWAVECETGWRLSDYGIDKLFKLCAAASEATEPAELLTLCDLIMNVAHQRSDLASWFVAGGTRTLSELADGVRPSDKPEFAGAMA